MDKTELLTKLFQFGWKLFPTLEETIKQITDPQLNLLQKVYAAFHGLSSIGDVFAHLNEIRFCKHPDTMQTQATRCQWPDVNVTWDVLDIPPGFPGGKSKYVECAAEAFARWARVCGLRPQYTPQDPQARIKMSVRAIDGPFGVLAESELPCGLVATCNQWYDTGEKWAIFDGAGPGNTLDIIRVMTHELGHALGMNHIGGGNLLAPTYSPQISIPQAGDIAEMQARYGPPVPQAPPPPSSPAGGSSYTLHFNDGVMTVDGYRLTKLLEAA